MSFTLEQLAHFDRCLFPDSIAEDIGRIAGYDAIEIWLLKLELRKKTPLNVVGMFQDRICDKVFCTALDEVLKEFCKKYYT